MPDWWLLGVDLFPFRHLYVQGRGLIWHLQCLHNEREALEAVRIDAEVPLAEMFGYSTDLRSGTAGKATYSMEFAEYKECPSNIQEKVIKERQDKLAKEE